MQIIQGVNERYISNGREGRGNGRETRGSMIREV